MSKLNKYFLLFLIICLGLGLGLIGLANGEPADSDEIIILEDETVEPGDLDTKEPKLLPNNPFYFVKEWGRGIQSFFAFGRIKKAELEQKFANEKLMELKTMVEEGKASEKVLERATKKYEKSIGKIKEKAEEIKGKAEENEKVDKFLDKFTKHNLLHQKILEKLETQVPEKVMERIKETRKEHLEKFEQVMNKLEEKQERVRERINEAKEEIEKRIDERIKKFECEIDDDCPKAVSLCGNPTGPNYAECIKKTTINYKCINGKCVNLKSKEIEPGACILIYDPVCGEDNKTYSNECFARKAGVEVQYKGRCRIKIKGFDELFLKKEKIQNKKTVPHLAELFFYCIVKSI